MADVELALVSVPVVLEPGAGRAEAGEDEYDEPDVIGVLLQERSLVAVDIGRSARMGRQRGVLVGIGFLDLRGGWLFLRQLLAVGEELPGKGGHRRLRQ